MECIDCDGKTTVWQTVKFEGVVFRKHTCNDCGRSFFTMEDLIDEDDPNLKAAMHNLYVRRKERRQRRGQEEKSNA